jgi:histidinol-phosphate aminotransferase
LNKRTIDDLIRPNIRRVHPYSSARLEYSGRRRSIFLDANENSMGSVTSQKLNRYPDPLQKEIKAKLAGIKKVRANRIFIGNGSDEAVDLLVRIFCEPRQDALLIFPPTYGVYAFFAEITDVRVDEIPLTRDFRLDTKSIFEVAGLQHKLMFICSPNNPTANLMCPEDVKIILDRFQGIVVIDEAYIDFCPQKTFMPWLKKYPRLVILQTFSKAWGLANIRMGMAYADPRIIEVMNTIKYPYNVSGLTQQTVLKAFDRLPRKEKLVAGILRQRQYLERELTGLSLVAEIYPSQANFILVRVHNAAAIYKFLLTKNIIIRDRSHIHGCSDCLRITVGTATENRKLIAALKEME